MLIYFVFQLEDMRRIDNRACDAAACEEETVKVMVKHDTCKTKGIQDGPSLESSSCLNVSLRYLDPWDPGTLGPLDLGTPWTLEPLGPWDSWTSSLLQHLIILPLTSS